MADFKKFNYKNSQELSEEINELGVNIDANDDLAPLVQRKTIGMHILPNPLVIHPMEGCDGTENGLPSDLTFRRYKRFARGGAGLIWFEATAVVPEGRANPRQLLINRETLPHFKKLVAMVSKEAEDSMGIGHKPVCILQLTHSGRYSKPYGKPQPIIAFNDANLDARSGVEPDTKLVSDDYLDRLQGKYVEAACLAREAGFDGVDIKSCHRYLLSELLAGHTRHGKYGGSFENRTRFLLETVDKVRSITGEGFILAVRMNAFDGLPYPYGWGVSREDENLPDLSEPKQLVQLLNKKGVSVVSITAGNPYYKKPYITRPFDVPVAGAPFPDEHPLESVSRLFLLAREIQKAVPKVAVVGGGYSWLRQYSANAAAAHIAKGDVSLVGFGRFAFAYPDFAKDILECGSLDKSKVCIACSKCTQIMRDKGRTGCVIRDSEIYLPIYKQGREGF